MRYIYILIALLLVLFLPAACIDDKGNYHYIPAEDVLPIVVRGLPADTSVQQATQLVIDPILEGLPKAESEYEFAWYSFATGSVIGANTRDTVSRERKLDFQVMYTPGEKRELIFVICDKATQVRQYNKVGLTSVATFASGYYILKDFEDGTDMDYINLEGEIFENVLSPMIDRRLAGKALQVGFQDMRYTHMFINEDGTATTVSNQAVFHIFSEEDGCVINAHTLQPYKTSVNEMFYADIDVVRPQRYSFSRAQDNFFINNGLMYSIYGMGSNVGKYPDYKSGYTNLASHTLADNDMVGSFPSVMCFDLTARSFCYATAWDVTFFEAALPPASGDIQVSPRNMDATLVDMFDRNSVARASLGWALMKGVSKPDQYYLAQVTASSNTVYPFSSFDTLAPTRQLPLADVRAAHRTTGAIYFAKDNKVSYYLKNATEADSEEIEMTFPEGYLASGEKVSYLQHLYSTGFNTYDELVMLTNSSDGWKLYIMPVVAGTPRVDLQKVKIFSGEGNARYMIRR